MTAKVTVSLPDDLLGEAKDRVRAGDAESLSAFVATALRKQLSRDRGLAELERVMGGRPPVSALAAVRRDWGLDPLPEGSGA